MPLGTGYAGRKRSNDWTLQNLAETKKRIGHRIFQPERLQGIGWSRYHMLYLKALKLDYRHVSTHVYRIEAPKIGRNLQLRSHQLYGYHNSAQAPQSNQTIIPSYNQIIKNPYIWQTQKPTNLNPIRRQLTFISILLFYGLLSIHAQAQVINSGQPVLEEMLRRQQLAGKLDQAYSFHLRPLTLPGLDNGLFPKDWGFFTEPQKEKRPPDFRPDKVTWQWLTDRFHLHHATNRPYGYGNGPMIPAVGFQLFVSGGVEARYKFLYLLLQPEVVLAQNKAFDGFQTDGRLSVNNARYYYWNYSNIPERFDGGLYTMLLPGQSKLTAQLGGVEMGFSTQTLWWGPGQFNSLIFSNNAPGFPHFTLNSHRPLQTFAGSLEFQFISGWLNPYRGQFAQDPVLNQAHYRVLPESNKYLNGITLSYQPKWIPGLHLGASRVFQGFTHTMGSAFGDIFPVFGGITKASTDLLEIEQSGAPEPGRDQQLTVFGRYLLPKAHMEFYAEFGRRDHALNWREFTLNPEHARAFLMGFQKLFPLEKEGRWIQVRGEMAQQQESINRIIRYGSGSGATWGNHGNARGFTQSGQALGMGIGTGNNHQLLELSWVDQFNKRGILLERMVNNQDFYYRAGFPQRNIAPWVDMSLGLLWDQRWDRMLVQSKLQMIYANNYQWDSRHHPQDQFMPSSNKFSLLSRLNFIYLFGK